MTNLEKHQKIYKLTGIEPKWWAEGYYGLQGEVDNLTTTRDKSYCHGHGDYGKADMAYYPAEQLWEILSSTNGDLHPILLDMVLWEIKEGHIQKEQECS